MLKSPGEIEGLDALHSLGDGGIDVGNVQKVD
jgi:hypothetical protein